MHAYARVSNIRLQYRADDESYLVPVAPLADRRYDSIGYSTGYAETITPASSGQPSAIHAPITVDVLILASVDDLLAGSLLGLYSSPPSFHMSSTPFDDVPCISRNSLGFESLRARVAIHHGHPPIGEVAGSYHYPGGIGPAPRNIVLYTAVVRASATFQPAISGLSPALPFRENPLSFAPVALADPRAARDGAASAFGLAIGGVHYPSLKGFTQIIAKPATQPAV